MRGKRVCGPRRVVLLSKSVKNGVIADEAIDLAKSKISEYWDSLFGIENIVFKDGSKPTYFTILPMTTAQIRLEPESSEIDIASYRVLCSLIKIENYHIVDDAGAESAVTQPDRTAKGQLGEMASEAWLNASGLTSDDILGLSTMIKHISEPQIPFYRPSGKPSGLGEKSEG